MNKFFKIKKFDPEKIIKKHDADALCRLNDDDFIEFSIALMYEHFYNIPLEKLNSEQRTVFLCMALESACQADSILSLTEDEDLFFAIPEMYSSLLSIGSHKTAAELKRFIVLMPEGTFESRIMPEWDWFFGDSEREKQINRIDSAIAGYPDGLTSEMLKKYCTSDKQTAEKVLAGL